VIKTLTITVIVEGVMGIGYAVWRKKPIAFIFVTSILANLITQSLLWIVLNIFFQRYLATLLIAEILIWGIETILFYGIRSNKLSISDAAFLSFIANLSSFALGWWLPI